MDVRLPDGTVVKNVPEGTTKAQLMAMLPPERFAAIKAEGNIQKPPTPFRPSGETALSPGEEILANPYGRAAVGMAKPFLGTGQLALNAVGQGEGINREMANLRDATAKAREYVGSRGVDLADLTGQAATMAIPAGMMSASATTAGRIGQGALLGGATGLTTPVEDAQDTGDFFGKKAVQTAAGVALGAAVPGAWELAKAGGRGVRNVVQPYMGEWGADRAAGRLANTAAGDRADAIITALRNPQQTIPGASPSAAQAALPVNSAEFSGLERLAAERKPSEWTGALGLEGKQNQARIAALRTVGQDKPTLDAAINARSAQAAQNYDTAFANQIRGDSALIQMSKNPYFKDAMADATKLAEANGISPKTDLTQFLHYVKVSLDKQLLKQGDTALGNTEKKAVQDLQKQLVGWMGNKNPAYEAARADFAAASKPINQMEIGQELENKLVPALSGDAKQRSAAYAQALRDAPGTIKRATGQPRYDDLAQIMRPDQMEVLRGVHQDLARASDTANLASKGLPMARELIGRSVPDAPSPGVFNQIVAAARAGYNRVAGKATDKILDDLAIKMQDPQKMADIMYKAKPFQRQALVDALMRYQAPAGVAAANEGVE